MTNTAAQTIDPDATQVTNFRVYVAGFLLDDNDQVLLVRKNRPAWQSGKLNGIGGKVEPGESGTDAMRREFREEAGLDIRAWEKFVTLTFAGGVVNFFRAFAPTETLTAASTQTDEAIELWRISDLLTLGEPIIPNLRWILPLAAYRHDRYLPMGVVEVAA